MGIKEMLGKLFKKDEEFKQMEKEMKMRKLLEQRSKNSNERELERFMEEDRQESIKEALEDFRKKRKMQEKENSILKSEKNILHNDFDILKERNLFSAKSTNLGGKGMFWK